MIRIRKSDLRKLIKEELLGMEAPTEESWELAMEKVFDLATMTKKVNEISEDAVSAMYQEHDRIESKAYKLQRSGRDVPSGLISKLDAVEGVLSKVRQARKTSAQMLMLLKDYI